MSPPGEVNALRSLLKNSQSPWFGSTLIFDLLLGSSTGCGSGSFDIPTAYLRPVLLNADSPLRGFPSCLSLLRADNVAVDENEDR